MAGLRKVNTVVISDVHLGTYGCQAKALLCYLKSIDPERIILNGDIIDIWQFNKRYWPKSHMKIIKHLMKWIVAGKQVYYITGNHDEMLRKFKNYQIGNFSIVNKLVVDLEGEKAWFFHGDIFDVTMRYSKWLTRLGGMGYDALILLNSCINWLLIKMGKSRMSFSKTIKNSVKSAVKYINQFEQVAVDIAARNGYKYVVCGHIHQPNMETFTVDGKSVVYLNSGDWIENLSALKYHQEQWKIIYYDQLFGADVVTTEIEDIKNSKELFEDMLLEFNMMKN